MMKLTEGWNYPKNDLKGEDQGGKIEKGKKRAKYSCMHPFGNLRSMMQWQLGCCDQANA